MLLYKVILIIVGSVSCSSELTEMISRTAWIQHLFEKGIRMPLLNNHKYNVGITKFLIAVFINRVSLVSTIV